MPCVSRRRPQIRVLNKHDVVLARGEPDERVELSGRARGPEDAPEPVARTSAIRRDNIDELLRYVDDALSAMDVAVHVLLPFEEGKLLNEIHSTGRVLETEHLATGTRVRARVPDALKGRLKEFRLRPEGGARRAKPVAGTAS